MLRRNLTQEQYSQTGDGGFEVLGEPAVAPQPGEGSNGFGPHLVPPSLINHDEGITSNSFHSTLFPPDTYGVSFGRGADILMKPRQRRSLPV